MSAHAHGTARRGPAAALAAAMLALLWPGAGHLAAGHAGRAFAVAAGTAFILLPAALWLWAGAAGGVLRTPAAVALLALPALDAARRAAGPRPPSRGPWRLAAAALGLALAAPAFLLAEYVVVTTRWLVAMELDRESMRPNLLPGDLVLVDVRPGAVAASEPGELVVFEHPAGSGRLHAKRLVARDGAQVALEDGGLLLEGVRRTEAEGGASGGAEAAGLAVERIGAHRYATRPGAPGAAPPFGPAAVPAGHFFALGDDRAVSRDSRAFGPVEAQLLRGRPVRVLWSRDPATKALRRDRWGADPRVLP